MKNKRILVVDDDATICEILTNILESEDYNVDSAQSGKLALKKMSEHMPNLILLDYFLMGENFLDTFRSFSDLTKDAVPIILMSANTEAIAASQGLAINEFLPKPFQRDTVLNAVERNS